MCILSLGQSVFFLGQCVFFLGQCVSFLGQPIVRICHAFSGTICIISWTICILYVTTSNLPGIILIFLVQPEYSRSLRWKNPTSMFAGVDQTPTSACCSIITLRLNALWSFVAWTAPSPLESNLRRYLFMVVFSCELMHNAHDLRRLHVVLKHPTYSVIILWIIDEVVIFARRGYSYRRFHEHMRNTSVISYRACTCTRTCMLIGTHSQRLAWMIPSVLEMHAEYVLGKCFKAVYVLLLSYWVSQE
jgi:hypothetical protein